VRKGCAAGAGRAAACAAPPAGDRSDHLRLPGRARREPATTTERFRSRRLRIASAWVIGVLADRSDPVSSRIEPSQLRIKKAPEMLWQLER